jgi:hypothetical protein
MSTLLLVVIIIVLLGGLGYGGGLYGGGGLGDALALAFQHDLPFSGRHTSQDRQHKLAGGVAGIQPFATHRQNDQSDAALGQICLDRQQLRSAVSQAIWLGHHQHVTFRSYPMIIPR